MNATQLSLHISNDDAVPTTYMLFFAGATNWIRPFAMSSIPNTVTVPPPGKRKEIYKYDAPWTLFSMNWSIRPDKRFRLALGSFVEEYNNKVSNLWLAESSAWRLLAHVVIYSWCVLHSCQFSCVTRDSQHLSYQIKGHSDFFYWFLTFSCGSLIRSCWAELKYGIILASGVRGLKLWLIKVQKTWISSISGPSQSVPSPPGWQVWSSLLMLRTNEILTLGIWVLGYYVFHCYGPSGAYLICGILS